MSLNGPEITWTWINGMMNGPESNDLTWMAGIEWRKWIEASWMDIKWTWNNGQVKITIIV